MESNDLERILNILSDLGNNSGSNKKLEILKSNINDTQLQRVFKYAYDKDYKYGVSGSRLVKINKLIYDPIAYEDIFYLLDLLRERKLTGNAALEACNEFYSGSPCGELLKMILNHDLNDGIGVTTLKKVWPSMFSSFGVALAEVWSEKYRKKVDFTKETWYASRKLDGVRCICIKKGNDVKFFSRSGKEYLTLNMLKNEILKLSGDFVLDGECCIVDKHGDENFTDIIKEIKRKNHTIEKPCYMVFDCLTIQEFESHISSSTLMERYDRINNLNIDSDFIRIVEQMSVNDYNDFDKYVSMAAENCWEGIMLRKDTVYEGKRSNNMLKVKKFLDAEYTVIAVHNDILKWTENGRQIERECLSNIEIEHKGSIVSVGSGFSKEQRIYYYEHPDELIGATITVKYFQESQNENGGWSLRFPTVKAIYPNGREL